jgi:hypothetical protein
MYGSAIGTLKVSVANSDISQSLFTKSSNQGNQWYFQKVYIPVLPNGLWYTQKLKWLLCFLHIHFFGGINH